MMKNSSGKQQSSNQLQQAEPTQQQRSSFPYKPFKIQKQHVNFQQPVSSGGTNLVSQATQTQNQSVVGLGPSHRQSTGNQKSGTAKVINGNQIKDTSKYVDHHRVRESMAIYAESVPQAQQQANAQHRATKEN